MKAYLIWRAAVAVQLEHIHAISEKLSQAAPREVSTTHPALRLSGLEDFTLKGESKSLIMVGERTNVTGSPRFRKPDRIRRL